MKMQRVASTTLKEIGYDPERRELRVSFANGAVHDYSGVPSEHHSGLLTADSHGGYFHRHIRGRYPSMKAGTRPEEDAPPEATAPPEDVLGALERAARRYRG